MAAQRLIPEPSRAGRNAAAWWPAIIGLERLTDAITRAALDTPPPTADVAKVVTAIREIAAAIHAERLPSNQPLPAIGLLAVVAADITALHGALLDPLSPNAGGSVRDLVGGG